MKNIDVYATYFPFLWGIAHMLSACFFGWVHAWAGHGLFNHRLLFTAPTFTERIQPVSLAQTSVTTSLWIISDGDDDEVVMEHCCVAAVSVSARPPSITDRPGQLFTGRSQRSLSHFSCPLHRA